MTAPVIVPGLHPDLPREQYDGIDAVNQSSLKRLINGTPADYRWALDHPEPPSDAMMFGQAVHLACYEPARFALEVVARPDTSRRSNAGKAEHAAFEAAAAGKTIIDAEDYGLIGAIQRAVMEHESAAKIIALRSRRELTAVWRDSQTGLLCKGRLDQLADGMIVDLKTSKDGLPRAFEGDVLRYGYHIQAAFYTDGVVACGEHEPAFAFIAVDKERVQRFGSRAVAVYEIEQPAIELGRIEYRQALETIADCRRKDHWPCFAPGIAPISVPMHALKRAGVESMMEYAQ